MVVWLGSLGILLGSADDLCAGEQQGSAVRIGMIQSLFRGSDAGAMMAQAEPFNKLLYSQTGVRGQFQVISDAADMGRQLQQGELQLGILHGVEYAWIKDQYPDLQPLVLAFNQTTKLQGYLLVRADNPVQDLAGLSGKTLAMPKRSMNHCHLFLHKALQEEGLEPAGFFGPSPIPANTEAALDAVVDGKAAAVVVDGVALALYRERKPGRAAKLRVLKESGPFPTATIIYRPGGCDEATIKRVVDGMTTAHQRVLGRQMLTLWRLSQFSRVPAEYQEMLSEVLKAYPEPICPARFTPEPQQPTAQQRAASREHGVP
jgi:ABC-type phosphate/phosphonate transport system substrate-binding protein